MLAAREGGVPNTDPTAANAETFSATSVWQLGAPGATVAVAEAFSAQVNAPLNAAAQRWRWRR